MIEVDDALPGCVQRAIDQVEEALTSYCREEDPDEVPCLFNDLDAGGNIHEIIDGACPIWDAEIKAAWFLHENELESAYENAGVGDNPRHGNGTAAIYYYIHQEVSEWYEKNAARIWTLTKQEKE
jgi:hypothetical protein